MNERYAIDPSCFTNSAELKGLLEKFGIFTGRYLTQYPDDWEERLLNIMSKTSPVESSKISTLLRRAKERYGLIRQPRLMWMDRYSWSENAGKLTAPPSPVLDGLVIPNDSPHPPFKSWEFDDVDLPPTAEERIPSTPDEYVRASKLLLLVSHELIFVDPYLNPCDRFVAPVFSAMLAKALGNGSKCGAVKCYARSRNILTETTTLENVKHALNKILEQAKVTKPFKLQYTLLDDSFSSARMHDRYLCSVKGGIQLSQGFQTQRRHGKVTVSPVSPGLHKEIWDTYFEGQHGMRIDKVINVP